MKTLSLVAACVLSGLVVAGCGDSDSPTSPSANGNFRMMMKDAPYDDARAVLVTFSAIEVTRSNGATSRLDFAGGGGTRTCDLKKLQTSSELVGTAQLDSGDYSSARFVVQSATLYYDNPSSGGACAASITPPSGRSEAAQITSGDVRVSQNFSIQNNSTTTMTVDFDGAQSLRGSILGSVVLSPVIVSVGVSIN